MPIWRNAMSLGWWTTQMTLRTTDSEMRKEVQAACKYSWTSDCPYRRDDFDCADCVIKADGVHLRI